jgi:2-keto-3-deoxy-L-rhamnonate aldolase RhmA
VNSIATRLLDNSVLGIVVPHVETADEAREVVQKLKYPPIGHRLMGGTGPHYGLRAPSTDDAAQALNAANLTVVMLETPTVIANADAIAGVPGVDVLLIGTNDLCAEIFRQRTCRGCVSDHDHRQQEPPEVSGNGWDI